MQIVQHTSLGRNSVIATTFTAVLMLAVAVLLVYLDYDLWPASIALVVMLVAMCWIAMCFMPKGLILNDEALIIIFPCRSKALMVADIAEAAPFTATNRMWRVSGSGAFFGWWGWYAAKGIGRFMLYASTLDQLLMIKLTSGKRYVVSCSDTAVLLTALSKSKK